MPEQIDPSMTNFTPNMRNQRPPLLPTPSHPPRFSRNMSMNSDSSRGMNGPDDIESVDMEMSDDDTCMDNRSVGSSGGGELQLDNVWLDSIFLFSDHRDFQMQNQMFPLPHQVNLNHPPPPLMNEMDLSQQRKPWMHNNIGGDQSLHDDGGMNQMNEGPPSLLGMPPGFMNHNQRFPGPPGSFRGNRGRGGPNGSPYNNNFRGRGGPRPRGRSSFRGNFKGQGQW